MSRLSVQVSLLAATLFSASVFVPTPGVSAGESITKAVCQVRPTKGNKCRGVVIFQATQDGKIRVTARIRGLSPGKKHAIHIHQFGDCRDLAGKSAGGHFNPKEQPHGLPPAAKRHAGDLGNLQADDSGAAKFSIVVDNISVAAENAVIGRAIVVHALVDDGGQPTGNAGARIGCGVIGIANPEWKHAKAKR